MSDTRPALRPGDRLPPMIGVAAHNLIDGLRVWGQVDNETGRIRLEHYGSMVETCAALTSSGAVRVEVTSPVEGSVAMYYQPDDVVLVEITP